MSAIAGVLRLDDRPVERPLVERMVRCLDHRGPDGQNVWCRGRVGLGHCALFTTPESLHEDQPVIGAGGDLVLVADARLDNREDLIRDLVDFLPTSSRRQATTDADLLVAAYRKWRVDMPSQLIGDFAFAIWEEGAQRLFCVRDHIGVRSFYYHHQPRQFAFATEIRAIRSLPWVPSEIDNERVAKYLSLDFDDVGTTFYKNIRRLPPAHWLSIGPDHFKIGRYWVPECKRELRLGSDQEYEEAFRELFLTSVRARLRSAFPVGSTLSGGLDSSSICCAAREIRRQGDGAEIQTYSLVFPGLSQGETNRIDERHHAQAVIAGGGLDARFVTASELSPVDDLPWLCETLDEPNVPFNLYLHLAMYRLANAEGTRVLLDGFDGDTTLSYGYGRFAELAASLKWITLAREIRAFAGRVPNPSFTPWKILQTYGLRPLCPAPLKRVWRGLRSREPGASDPAALVGPELAQAVGARSIAPQRDSSADDTYRTACQEHLVALQSALIPWSLEVADKVAGIYSLDLRFPFFDRRLMEFCLSLPPEQKLRDGWTRWILRRAMDGLLPSQVQWRLSKADLSPNFHRGMRANEGRRLRGILSPENEALSGYINTEEASKLLDDYLEMGGEHRAMSLFSAASLASWLRQQGTDDDIA